MLPLRRRCCWPWPQHCSPPCNERQACPTQKPYPHGRRLLLPLPYGWSSCSSNQRGCKRTHVCCCIIPARQSHLPIVPCARFERLGVLLRVKVRSRSVVQLRLLLRLPPRSFRCLGLHACNLHLTCSTDAAMPGVSNACRKSKHMRTVRGTHRTAQSSSWAGCATVGRRQHASARDQSARAPQLPAPPLAPAQEALAAAAVGARRRWRRARPAFALPSPAMGSDQARAPPQRRCAAARLHAQPTRRQPWRPSRALPQNSAIRQYRAFTPMHGKQRVIGRTVVSVPLLAGGASLECSQPRSQLRVGRAATTDIVSISTRQVATPAAQDKRKGKESKRGAPLCRA